MKNDLLGYDALRSKLTETDDGGFESHIPDNWRQGRTAYGGLTTGLAYSAAQKAFADLPHLRSAQVTFVGPVVSDPTFTSRLLRQGRNVTSVIVEANCEEDNVAIATFMFGGSRESQLNTTLAAADSPAPEDCDAFIPEGFQGMAPGFTLNFDTRLIEGHRPMMGASEGYIRVWSRHRDVASREGIGSFLTIGDVLQPAAATTMKSMSAISSMNWHMNILEPEVGTDEGWWQIETKQTAAKDGYSSQVMRFWNRAGVLVAEGMQSVAVFS